MENKDLENLVDKKAQEIYDKKYNCENNQQSNEEKNELKVQDTANEIKKSIDSIGISDIKFTIDEKKSYEQQTEDVVGAMATAKAVSDEKTATELANNKAEELKVKSQSKVKKAEADLLSAETEKQKADRELYEAVLESFCIKKHLPSWLMKFMVFMITPFYVVITLFIGIPGSFCKILIDNLDNIFVRYETSAEKSKGKIKVSVILILVVAVLISTLLTVLKIYKII